MSQSHSKGTLTSSAGAACCAEAGWTAPAYFVHAALGFSLWLWGIKSYSDSQQTELVTNISHSYEQTHKMGRITV